MHFLCDKTQGDAQNVSHNKNVHGTRNASHDMEKKPTTASQ